jgi:hypothetical protein
MGLDHPGKLGPSMLMRRVDEWRVLPYSEIMTFLEPGELLAGTDKALYREWWAQADPDDFKAGLGGG